MISFVVAAGCQLGVDHAGGDLQHPDGHKGHQADDRVVGLDEDDRPSRDVRKI
jgi:hypothetical protein